ncbi:hypothetical protein BGX28_007877 [Mortierella sp. GBA30]|nr:hypothetical protein BGX28_007877 [Mortierella sp. GBA30]
MTLSEDHYPLLIITATILIFLYIARDYPLWKADRLLQSKDTQAKHEETDSTTTESLPESVPPSSPWLNKFSIRWIPYLPFAIIYLLLKAAWTGFRQLVLHSILFGESLAVHLVAGIEEAVQWTFLHGPEFLSSKILTPIRSAAMIVWQSPALSWAKITMKKRIIPGTVRVAGSALEVAKVASAKIMRSVKQAAEPIRNALLWFVMECIYTPVQAIWTRLVLLNLTFIQTAKIYFHELAKDAADLGMVLLRSALWVWSRLLQPAGTRFYAWASVIVQKFAVFLPWLTQRMYSWLLRPIAVSFMEIFRIMRSHPTLLAGLGALSSKIKDNCNRALERLESVNWLILLEIVLTKAVSSLYHYTVCTYQLLGQGIKVFTMDMVPSAITDLMMALEVARPVVARITDKVVRVAQPLWQAVTWILWSAFVNTRPCLTWLYQTIAVPAMNIWDSKIVPALDFVLTTVFRHIKVMSGLMVHWGYRIAATFSPVWGLIVKVTEVLQTVAAQFAVMIVQLSGGLGEYIQEHIKSLEPKYQTFKEHTGQVMDEIVLTASNLMMDWAKGQKRD